jgi:hypothetical protein
MSVAPHISFHVDRTVALLLTAGQDVPGCVRHWGELSQPSRQPLMQMQAHARQRPPVAFACMSDAATPQSVGGGTAFLSYSETVVC